MTLSDLLKLFRLEADDFWTPQLWTDDELIEFANDGEEQACRRARLLVDSTTAGVCRLSFTAGDSPVLTLSPVVLTIRQAVWVSSGVPVVRRVLAPMLASEMYADWDTLDIQPQQQPDVYITDVQTQAIRLHPTPAVNGAVELSVFRLPIDKMAALGDEPSIPAYAHRALVQWMLYRAYSKQDADALDAEKAKSAYGLFVQEFGDAKSARNQAWMQQEVRVFPDPLC
ncbi:hypothetical protein BH20PSE1_BH20PSE1_01090 [soil metagenome]